MDSADCRKCLTVTRVACRSLKARGGLRHVRQPSRIWLIGGAYKDATWEKDLLISMFRRIVWMLAAVCASPGSNSAMEDIAGGARIAKALQKAYAMPVLTGATLTGVERVEGRVVAAGVCVKHVIRDFPGTLEEKVNRPRKHTVTTNYRAEVGGPSTRVGAAVVQDESFRFTKHSPTFKWTVTHRVKDGKPLLMIWQGSRLVGEVDLGKHHGELCSDDFFGWVGWDEAEGLLVYQAEGLPAEPAEFQVTGSFGETMPKRIQPRVFVLRLADGTIQGSLPVSEAYTPTRLLCAAGTVYFVGVATGAQKYGLAYCPNRHSALYRWDGRGTPERLTAAEQVEVVDYPVLDTENGRVLVFGTYAGGSHYHAFSLYSVCLTSGAVARVHDDGPCSGGISGLFPIDNPPQHAQAGRFWISSFSGTQQVLLSVEAATGAVRRASPGTGTWELHQVVDGALLASVSSRDAPPKLLLGLPTAAGDLEWHDVTAPAAVPQLEYELIHVDATIDIILSKPAGTPSGELPLIVFPHGGPNFAYGNTFSLLAVLAAELGYALAAVNYTGSAGYGQEAIRRLEGNVGTLDVADCLRATGHLVAERGFSRDRLYLFGGSHGGFLVCHLSCTAEFRFRACAAHNPVVDLGAMAVTSDIPDFAWGQLGLPYDLQRPRPATEDEQRRMFRASPSSRVHEAHCPTVVLLGEGDLRVPPSQGRAWCTWLRARGVPCELYSFPGTGHAIDSATGEYNEYLRVFSLFGRHK